MGLLRRLWDSFAAYKTPSPLMGLSFAAYGTLLRRLWDSFAVYGTFLRRLFFVFSLEATSVSNFVGRGQNWGKKICIHLPQLFSISCCFRRFTSLWSNIHLSQQNRLGFVLFASPLGKKKNCNFLVIPVNGEKRTPEKHWMSVFISPSNHFGFEKNKKKICFGINVSYVLKKE